MRVLFVSSGKIKGQPGPIIQMQGNSLVQQGIDISYYTLCSKGFRGYFTEILRLKKLLRNNTFDIIHAHYGLSAIVALLAKSNEKLLVSFMGDDLIGTNRINGRVTRRSLLLARFNAFLAHRYYNHSIVKSTEMLGKLNTLKVSLIPNGVNIEVFQPGDKSTSLKKLGINTTDKLIIFVSDPTRVEKNFELARKAVQYLNTPDIQLLTVYGVHTSELCNYYNAADVLVLTSYHEGSPNVIKEAMACNCPIVSTPVGDVSWIFGETDGCSVARYEVSDFANKIKSSLKFSETTGRTTGREQILKLGLDATTVANKIIDVYKNLLN